MGTIDYDLLKLFVAVAEAGSFSAAAERLRLPKSSVSRGVARLERELGAQLFQRTTRRVALSTAGEALRERVAPLLRSLAAALQDLPEREEEPSGTLRLTAPGDLGDALLGDLVARFSARHPLVEVELHLTSREVDLVAGGFDAAVRASGRPLRDSTLVARRIGPSVMALFASPVYLARRGAPRTAGDLEGHDWVLFRGLPGELRLDGPDGATAVAPRGRVRCDDLLFVRAALRAGAGIGLLPPVIAARDVADGHLARVLPRHELRGGNLYFLVPRAGQLPRKVTAFRDMLIEELG